MRIMYGGAMIQNINNIENLPPVNFASLGKNNSQSHNLEIANQFSKNLKNNEIEDYLKSTSLNLNLSDSIIDKSSIKFNLTFNSNKHEELNVNGVYNFTEKTLSFNLSFKFKREIEQEGEKLIKNFLLELSFNHSTSQTVTLEQNTQKEDIMEFIRKVASKVFQTLMEKGKYVAGIQFNEDDIKELLQLDDGKFYKILNEIISIAINLAKLKHIMNNEPAEGIILKPERAKWNVIEYSKSNSNNLEMNLSITPLD